MNRPSASISLLLGALALLLAPQFVGAIDSAPTTAPTDPALPAMAIRRFGDLRFAEVGTAGMFSADNKQVITWGNDLTIWDAATGEELFRFHLDNHRCLSAARFGPGKIAIAVTGDRTSPAGSIIVFDETLRKTDHVIDPTWKGPFNDFACAPDGSHFAIQADRLLLCEGKTGQIVRDFGPKAPPSPSMNVVYPQSSKSKFSDDGKTLVAAATDGDLFVVDAATGRDRVANKTYRGPYGSYISRDGKILAAIDDDRDLHFYETATGNELQQPPPATRPAYVPRGVSHPYFQQVTSGGSKGELAFAWDGVAVTATDTSSRPLHEAQQVKAPGIMRMLFFSADGTRLAAVSLESNRMAVFDGSTFKQISPTAVTMRAITALAVSPDGHELMVANGEGDLFRFDLDSGKLLHHRLGNNPNQQMRGMINSISYTGVGKPLLQIDSAGAVFINPTTLAMDRVLEDRRAMGIGGGAYSPDGRWCVQNKTSDLLLFDRDANSTTVVQHTDVRMGFNQLQFDAVSPDGSMVALHSNDGTRLLNLKTHQLGPLIRFQANFVTSATVTFAPNNRWVRVQIGRILSVFEAARLFDPPPALAVDPHPAQPANRDRIPTPVSTAIPLWTCQEEDIGVSGRGGDFTATSELLVIAGTPPARTPLDMEFFEVRTGRRVARIPGSSIQALMPHFVPGKPRVVTADLFGTVLEWDLRAAILQGKPAPSMPDETEDSLWDAVKDPDPAVGYRAGFHLLDRHQLLARAAKLSPLRDATFEKADSPIHKWIESLSSPVIAEREKAHKSLEAAGAEAIAEVRLALDANPQGDLAERLKDIAHVIGADDPATPSAPLQAVKEPTADPEVLRTARVVQLLEWSDDPAAGALLVHLTQRPITPTSKPAK